MSAKDRYQYVIFRVPVGEELSSTNSEEMEWDRGDPTTRLRASRGAIEKMLHYAQKHKSREEVMSMVQALRHYEVDMFALRGRTAIGDHSEYRYYAEVEIV